MQDVWGIPRNKPFFSFSQGVNKESSFERAYSSTHKIIDFHVEHPEVKQNEFRKEAVNTEIPKSIRRIHRKLNNPNLEEMIIVLQTNLHNLSIYNFNFLSFVAWKLFRKLISIKKKFYLKRRVLEKIVLFVCIFLSQESTVRKNNGLFCKKLKHLYFLRFDN